MAGLLGARLSGVGAMRAGWERLWTRAAFAVVATWAIVAIVAVVVVAPAWAWWSAALGHTIDGARLLGSPNLATLFEVFRESPFAARTIAVAAIAGAALALLLNPFLAGGVIGALVREPLVPVPGVDATSRVACFAADGVWFYGPLLRVALILWPIAAIAIGASAVVVASLLASAPVLALAGAALIVASGTLAVSMLVDLARVHVARTEIRRARSAVLGALRVVLQPGAPPVPAVAGVRPGPGARRNGAAGGARLAVGRDLAGDRRRRRRPAGARVRPHLAARDAGRERGGAGGSGCGHARRRRGCRRAASVAALEERPEMLVVVQGEAGEGGLAGDERRGGGDLPAEIAGSLPAEGDRRRSDADAAEA